MMSIAHSDTYLVVVEALDVKRCKKLRELIIPRDNTGFIYYSGVAVDKQY